MTAVTFTNSTLAKALADSLSLNDKAYVRTGTADPTSSATDAPRGSIYIRTGSSGGLVYRKTDDGSSTNWVVLGSGSSSGINYIANPDAESNADGWATYADAAGSSPVDGAGGSPNITFARSTSSPLRGAASFLLTKDAANRQGEGFSYAFTIAEADKAKVHTVRFNYSVASGTAVFGDSSDLRVYIYDVTNGTLIQPAPYTLQSNNSFAGIFQTNGDSTSYRLIVHVATTSATAYTIKFDDFSVSPFANGLSSVATDWVAYTPSWTSTGSAPAVGNGFLTGFWRRVGDSMQVAIRLSIGSTTTNGTGDYRWSLPAGYTIDAAKIPQSAIDHREVVGWGNIDDNTVSNYLTAVTIASLSTAQLQMRVDANINVVSNVTPIVPSTSDVFYLNAIVPIVGWSNALSLSQDADGREVCAEYTGATGSITGTQTIVSPTKVIDTHAAYNSSTGDFTAPISGIYEVGGHIEVTGTEAADNSVTITMLKNGSTVLTSGARVWASGITATPTEFRGFIQASAGDILKVQVASTITSPNFSGTGTANYQYFRRAPGNIGVLANETVAARVVGSSMSGTISTTFGGSATIVFGTTTYDTHGFHSSGSFTVPVSGRYQISAQVQVSGTEASDNLVSLALAKNGTQDLTGVSRIMASSLTSSPVQLTGSVQANAGDVLTLRCFTSITGPAFVNDSNINYCCIERVGN